MALKLKQSEFEIERDQNKCISCEVCVRQCSNDVHEYDSEQDTIYSDNSECVGCRRCETLCPTGALKIRNREDQFKTNYNWTSSHLNNIYRQADSGGVLLTGMGSDRPYTIYWDHILFNASQVTNPSIDPLREPMEIRTFIGRKPDGLEFKMKKTKGSKEGSKYAKNTIVQVASGRYGVDTDYLNKGAAIEIKIGQGAKPGIGGHLPGEKVTSDVSETRMIPVGSDALSPAPQHDIYSIEDLRQLIYALKEATNYEKPISVKIAAVHNVAAIASGIVRAGADVIAIDGFRGGTGAAPMIIKDHVGIPKELGFGAVDD